jgi:hypothetical protein
MTHVCGQLADQAKHGQSKLILCAGDPCARYRPEILTGYTQADVDEPIEEDS